MNCILFKKKTETMSFKSTLYVLLELVLENEISSKDQIRLLKADLERQPALLKEAYGV